MLAITLDVVVFAGFSGVLACYLISFVDNIIASVCGCISYLVEG
jgi:hypothetical protein